MATRRSSKASESTRSGSSPSLPPSSSSSYRLWDAFYVLLLLALPIKLLLDLHPDAFGREPANARKYILEQLGLAAAGFFGVVHMVNVMGDYCRRKQQTGQDLCKKGTPLGEVPIPESQGLAPGIIYLVIIIACQMLYTQSPESLANYNSSLLSICFMLFLGFVDDVLVRSCGLEKMDRGVKQAQFMSAFGQVFSSLSHQSFIRHHHLTPHHTPRRYSFPSNPL